MIEATVKMARWNTQRDEGESRRRGEEIGNCKLQSLLQNSSRQLGWPSVRRARCIDERIVAGLHPPGVQGVLSISSSIRTRCTPDGVRGRDPTRSIHIHLLTEVQSMESR